MSRTVNYYDILGISILASEQEMRAGYLKKIKEYHPDTYKGNKLEAENITAEINQAYTTLKDKDKKYIYDRKYGFDIKREKLLVEKRKNDAKQKKIAEKLAKKQMRDKEQGKYAQEKVAKEKAQEEANFNAKIAPDEHKVETNFFTKFPEKDVKSVTRKVLTPEQKEQKKEKIILDCIILILIIIIIVLIVKK